MVLINEVGIEMLDDDDDTCCLLANESKASLSSFRSACWNIKLQSACSNGQPANHHAKS